jgi:methylglutamate dehydrogenase subunit B
MRIRCPYCGDRDSGEFTYLGDANSSRPDPDAPEAAELFFAAVYLRSNPAGRHEDFWYHGFGCRSWLRIVRDTTTHEIFSVDYAAKGLGS